MAPPSPPIPLPPTLPPIPPLPVPTFGSALYSETTLHVAIGLVPAPVPPIPTPPDNTPTKMSKLNKFY